ncbi:MAG: hypothetical protein AB7G25_06315 [Sphingomonadaceae bacterium]
MGKASIQKVARQRAKQRRATRLGGMGRQTLRAFEPLWPAERTLLEQCAVGGVAHISDGAPRTRTDENVVRADFIRFLAVESGRAVHVHEQGIRLGGAFIEGELNLNQCVIRSLELRYCRFQADIKAIDARIGSLTLSGSAVCGMRCDRMEVAGAVFLDSNFKASGAIRLHDAKIGSLNCAGARLGDGKDALLCDGIYVAGVVNLSRGFRAYGEVSFIGSTIDGDLICTDGSFRDQENAILCDRSNIKGNVNLNGKFLASGIVSFAGARIKGNLDCSGGKFSSEKIAIHAARAKIEGDVFLRQEFHSNGLVKFSGSEIRGDFDCDNGKFNKNEGGALDCHTINIGGNINMRDNFHAVGEVSFFHAKVGGNFSCANGVFENDLYNSLTCDGLKVKGNLFFTRGFRSKGAVRLINATIGGSIQCDGKFDTQKGDALNCDSINVARNLIFSDSLLVKGTVHLVSAKIGGNFQCAGRIEQINGDGLKCDGINVNGSIIFRGCQVDGALRLLNSKISDDLDFTDGQFRNKNGYALECSGAVAKKIIFRNVKNIVGSISFAATYASTLVDDVASWNMANVIVLDGFRYQEIFGSCDAEMRISWLNKQPREHIHSEFRAQPWEHLTNTLRAMGDGESARQVAIEKQKKLRAAGKIGNRRINEDSKGCRSAISWLICQIYNFVAILLHRIYGTVIGYGHRPLRTVFLMLILCIFSSILYYKGREDGLFGPTASPIQVALANSRCGDAGEANKIFWTECPDMPSTYTTFQPFLYSLDLILPIVDLQQEKDWAPIVQSQSGETLWCGRILRWIVWLEILFGWAGSVLLVAVLGRLVSKD